jgi:hypothetical protein
LLVIIATLATSSYGWSPLWLLTKIPKEKTLGRFFFGTIVDEREYSQKDSLIFFLLKIFDLWKNEYIFWNFQHFLQNNIIIVEASKVLGYCNYLTNGKKKFSNGSNQAEGQ